MLLLFTLLSAVGYATFGRHPEWLQHIPSPFISELSLFFGVAFTFFAQGHIWISFGVLFIYLTQKTKFSWITGFIAVYAISLISELSGTRFGLPFGEYAYTELLGAKWFDLVPVLIPVSWFTMALPSFTLAWFAFPSTSQRLKRISFAAALLTLWDLSLDPAMSYLTTYWTWGEQGPYYGMPWINLVGWYATGLVLMASLHALKAEKWVRHLSLRWVSVYYGLVLLLPLLMCLAAGLWVAFAVTMAAVIPCAWLIDRNSKEHNTDENDFDSYGNEGKILDNAAKTPDSIRTEKLKEYFSSHSKSFSFAARFFSREQYQLVTRLYAFCRVTDDISDTLAFTEGCAKAEAELNEWEERVYLSYQGIPSRIEWLDELMTRSNQSGVPFDLVQDLIAGVRTDLRAVEIHTVEELNRYTYCVASVVGIWLCYLFGVRDREVLERASALGRAMQITNIVRDVGEDLRMQRLYLPTELMDRYEVRREHLITMDAGTLPITDGYKTLMEDLMERAEADYQYAFRGLSAVPPSFARAAAVASEVYRGIHRSLRRNRYDNFRKRAYTRWGDKIFLTVKALRRLKEVQNHPFIPVAEPVFFSNQQLSNNHNRQKPLIGIFILALWSCQSLVMPDITEAQQAMSIPAPASAYGLTSRAGSPPSAPERIEVTPAYVSQIRTHYLASVEHEASIEKGLQLIRVSPAEAPILEAYGAALTVLKAKHAFWPPKKMNYLKEGLPVLDELVEKHPEHVEIRYLRLISCYYLPGFLGMSDTVTEDAAVLAKLLPSSRDLFPEDLFYDMVYFVSNTKDLDNSQKQTLHRILSEAPSTRP